MRLQKLTIKNFLSVSEVEISPGHMNQIVGGNNQGKTTILRAIETALKGSSDASLVRNGEEMAEIVLNFDNGLTVHRKIRNDGKQGVLVKQGDMKAEKPQTMLDGIMAGISFNPLALLDPKERVKVLMQSIDIKLTPDHILKQIGDCPVPVPDLDYNQHGLIVAERAHQYMYQRRAEANKVAKQKAEVYNVKSAEVPPTNEALLPRRPEVPETDLRVAIAENQRKIQKELDKENMRKEAEAIAANKRKVHEQAALHLAQVENELKRAQANLNFRQEEAAKASEIAANMVVDTALINKLNDETAGLQREIEARAYEEKVKAQKEMLFQLKSAADEAKDFADKLDGAVEALGPAFQAKLIAEADLPVPGLEYREGQFFLNGSSIDNLSSSAALKLALALARRVSRDTKLICIDGLEMLDEKSFEELEREIAGDDFMYFVSKVGPAFPAGQGDKVVLMRNGQAEVQS